MRANELGFVRVTDLADELGVSNMTIRRDLDELTERGLIRRVRGGVVPESGAPAAQSEQRPPVSPDGLQVGVLVPDAGQYPSGSPEQEAPRFGGAYYFGEVLVGARHELESRGARARLMFSRSDLNADEKTLREHERQSALDMIASGAKGLLFSWATTARGENPSHENTEHLEWLRDLPVPVVLMEREAPADGLFTGTSSVRCAHEIGVTKAVQHLVAHGHRRIALLAHHYSQTSLAIVNGWNSSTAQLGLDGKQLYLTPELANWPSPAAVDALLDELLDSGATALICHNDHNSFAVLESLRARGIRVPQDFSLISYDDDFASMFDPALTAVSPPRAYLGRMAARLLIDLLEDPAHSGVSQIRVQPHLVVRNSVGTVSTS
jgi:DNA-binding LacI/PurR family transcriptional regulator